MALNTESLKPGMVTVVGIGHDLNSSFMRGPALAPDSIRETLHCGSANLSTETGIELDRHPRFKDLGDIPFDGKGDAFPVIDKTVETLVGRGLHVLSLGGDHAVTYPVVRGHHGRYPSLNILHLDAHPDLYEEFEGNRHSNACPFARIMEHDLARRLVQIGIRTKNSHQAEQADRFGVEMIEMKDWPSSSRIEFDGPVYLSLDLDVLDPGFAPGVSHHEPGGLTPREVITIIQDIKAPLVGADIVELNPKRDASGMSAMVAAKFLKEIAGKMIETNPAIAG